MTTSTIILQLLITLQSLFFLTCIPFLGFCLDTDTISPGLRITDSDTIVSAGEVFRLGFFSPRNSDNRYLGILHNSASEKNVWVANRNRPLNDSSGVATISDDGNLVLINGQNQTIWSTNATITPPRNTTVQILETGNLVLRDNVTGATIWDSFSNPANVYVPTMRISDDINTGKKVVLSSWKTESDPEVGNFTSGVQALNLPQIFIWNNGRPHWRSGPWNGESIGIKEMYSQYLSSATVVNDSAGLFYFIIPDRTFLAEIDLNSTGSLVQTLWNEERKNWDTVWFAPQGECDVYGTCGPFGSCNSDNSPICSCLRGFEPTNEEEWRRQNWTSGCRRINSLQCNQNGGSSDRFLRKQFMKVPDFPHHFPAPRIDDCESTCLRNCSCIAYVHDPNIGCMFFSETLIDVQEFSGFGFELYLRLSASDFGGGRDKKLFIIIPVACFVVLVIFIIGFWMIKRKGKQTKVKNNLASVSQTSSSDSTAIIFKDDSEKVNIKELPLLTFEMLANATDQFHDYNLLGKGGFGSVYRGNLGKGKEIAVKRLSAASGQGMEEFMNEVIVICKLQHRNLVRLLGCCVEKEEKMLVYEYMPNKSLDVHLFDPTQKSQKVLDWNRRFGIVEGIGRGLLYLHRDSRLRIIHRDLKPSNVLLDEEWEPKISDFGMARIFGGNEDYGNTARIVGTYGYMAPEYAMEGTFSEKSDVYSFGVLTLEIIKGQKNSQYYSHDWSLSLLGCAWKLWSEGKGLDFADEAIASPEFEAEIVRCIQIALLCVQENPKYRPSIQTALSMLSHEIVDLPAPEQPIFAEKWNGLHNATTQIPSQDGYSVNEISVSVVDGR